METTTQHSTGAPALSGQPQWLWGTVADIDGEICYVSLGDRTHEVRRAVSCLIAAQIGDQVCVFRAPDGSLYMTHVLARKGAAAVTLEASAGLELRSPQITLHAQERLRLEGERLEARFDRMQWFARLLQCTGIEFILNSKVARLCAQAVETLAARIQVAADRSYRNISEAEHLRTGVLDVKAQHVAHIRARNTILTAKELVKVDGSQIHVG